jgi:hypothetical protein
MGFACVVSAAVPLATFRSGVKRRLSTQNEPMQDHLQGICDALRSIALRIKCGINLGNAGGHFLLAQPIGAAS